MNQHEESMTKFEQELTQAMRAADPPEGFADRVMARAAAGDAPRARVLAMPRRLSSWSTGAIAAAVLAGAFFGEQMHIRHEREQAELARQQFDTAMQITGQTLEQARQQLQQAGISIGN